MGAPSLNDLDVDGTLNTTNQPTININCLNSISEKLCFSRKDDFLTFNTVYCFLTAQHLLPDAFLSLQPTRKEKCLVPAIMKQREYPVSEWSSAPPLIKSRHLSGLSWISSNNLLRKNRHPATREKHLVMTYLRYRSTRKEKWRNPTVLKLHTQKLFRLPAIRRQRRSHQIYCLFSISSKNGRRKIRTPTAREKHLLTPMTLKNPIRGRATGRG